MGIRRIVFLSALLIPAMPVFAEHSKAEIQQETASPILSDTPPQSIEALEQSFFKPYKATYSTTLKKGITIEVEGSQTLTQIEQGKWQLKFYADTFFATLSETSEFTLNKDQLRPSSYHYKSTVLGKEKETKLRFDWTDMIASNADRQEDSFSLKPDTLDRLSMQLQLRQDLLTKKDTLHYTVADDDKLKSYEFTRQGTETLETKLGNIEAIRVKRIDSNSKKRQSYFWFAPSYNFLLVKMEHHEKDESYVLNLEQYSEI